MRGMLSRDFKYIFLIVVIHLAACIETDIYLPAFPDMMDFFETSEEMIQGILSWNFLGVCLSCPFYGPLSDAFGRRKLILGALGIFLIGSIGTIFAGTIDEMLFYRVLQGIGSGGCFSVGAALIFDIWQGEKAVKVANDLHCIIPTIMAAAPMLGGYLNQEYGFRSNFITIAIFTLISFLLSIFLLEETHPVEKRKPLHMKVILRDFGRAMTCWRFWAPTFMICSIFASYLTYVSSIAILFVRHMGIESRIFPLYQATVLFAFVAASLLANRIINRWGMEQMKQWGLKLTYLGGVGFVISAWLYPESPNFFHAWMMVFAFGAGWVMGPYFSEGMESLPEIKGICGSLMSSFRLAFTAVVIAIVGAFFNGTVYPLLVMTASLLFLGGVVLYFNPKSVTE